MIDPFLLEIRLRSTFIRDFKEYGCSWLDRYHAPKVTKINENEIKIECKCGDLSLIVSKETVSDAAKTINSHVITAAENK